MKKILYIIFASFVLFSCKKETTEVLDMMINTHDISKVELRADHYMLLPNGKATMEFYPVVYVKKIVKGYSSGQDLDTLEQVVSNSMVPKGMLKVVDDKGQELVDNIFSTSDLSLAGKTINFKAIAGRVESDPLPIEIRQPAKEDYEEVVIPVIFHMILPPSTTGFTYNISSDYLQSVLDRMNTIFNGQNFDPNGGNAKITYKLAMYTPKGLILVEPGKNVIQLSEANLKEISDASGTASTHLKGYELFIVKNKSTCVWDPTKYLNVWLTLLSSKDVGGSTVGSYSYFAAAPKYMLPNYGLTSIKGLSGMVTKESYGLTDIVTGESCLQTGILVNYMAFLNPQAQNENNRFSLAVPLGVYYGLVINNPGTSTASIEKYPAADPDFCDDTIIHNYMGTGNNSVYKNNSSFKDRPANVPERYFTSFNCMEVYTRGTSFTVDQVARMRTVMKQCTNRQPINSSFALTGK